MIFSSTHIPGPGGRHKRFVGFSSLSLLASFALAGCPGTDDNSLEEGLTLHIAEVHSETTAPTLAPTATQQALNLQTTAAADPLFTIAAATGGYDISNLEHHNIVDGNGHLVSMYHAFVVIDDIDLIPCAELSQLPRWLLDSLIGTAQAHAGHGSEPVGGRSLDKANIIEIVTQDEYYLALGDIAVPPGRYCAARVSLGRFSGDGYGKPDITPPSGDNPTTVPGIPDMTGKTFALRADYCSVDDGLGNCMMRSKIDIDDTDLTDPMANTIVFNQPLEVSGSKREAFVAIGITYGSWMENVDASLLATDAIERQKLLDNIAGSIHIYDQGIGELPPNV